MTTAERRTRRSNDTKAALGYQLDRIRERSALEALVLGDADGLVVSASGDALACVELAALGPVVARGERVQVSHCRGDHIHVRVMGFEGARLFLVSCGDRPADAWSDLVATSLAEAERGVARILAA